MSASANAVWRVRPGGSNTNGGGFDCSLTSAATGTHGSFAGTTFTDTVAHAFAAGMVGSSLRIPGTGQYLITGFIDTSNITLGSAGVGVPPQMIGPVSWMVGKGQDYSQQNAAQLSQSSTANTSTATTTLTDTGAAFTAALIGNAIWISGTGLTTQFTFITAVPSGTTLTLQTSPGTTGTAVSYNIGGAWADPFTNIASGVTGFFSQSNTLYVLGAGIPNPASYTPDYTIAAAVAALNGTGGVPAMMETDPATPNYKYPPDTTGGMALIQCNSGVFSAGNHWRFRGLWFVAGTTTNLFVGSNQHFVGCVFDQFGNDVSLTATAGSSLTAVTGCELYSSVTAGAGTGYALALGANGLVTACNIHDCIGNGVNVAGVGASLVNNIIAKCNGATAAVNGSANINLFMNNTVDGNKGNGLVVTSGPTAYGVICNNIFSNHTVSGKIGLQQTIGSDMSKALTDYNVYYNNTTDISSFNYQPHDTHGILNPYVNQPTENYTLA